MIDELKAKLQAEVERLNHEISFVLPKEIEKALAHGDLRENSEFKAALERQHFASARLTHLRLRLSKLSGVSEKDIPRDRVGFGSRSRYGYRYGYGRRSPSLLHRVVKTAIWLYILHLFFTHGGLSILLWIIIIGFVVSLVRRRRRYADRAQSFWP